MPPLKIAIIGCGKIADGHVEEVRKLPGLARVVACCDLELLMAEQLASRYAIPRAYERLDELLDRERPDVLHIATPPASHVALGEQALAAGCHVYVEKPLALDAAGARRLVDGAARSRRMLTTGWSYLFDPPALAVRELVRAGALGEIVHAESAFGYQLDGQFGRAVLADPDHWVRRLPGQLVHNNLDHLLCKLVELFEDDAPPLHAFASVRREVRYGDARDHMIDELRLVVRGARMTAFGLFSSHARPVANFLHLYGTRRSLHADFVSRTVTFDDSPQLPSALGRLVPAFTQAAQLAREGGRNVLRFARSDFHYFSGLGALLRRYYEAIRDGGPPPIPYRDLLRVAVWMDQAVAQLHGTSPGAS